MEVEKKEITVTVIKFCINGLARKARFQIPKEDDINRKKLLNIQNSLNSLLKKRELSSFESLRPFLKELHSKVSSDNLIKGMYELKKIKALIKSVPITKSKKDDLDSFLKDF